MPPNKSKKHVDVRKDFEAVLELHLGGSKPATEALKQTARAMDAAGVAMGDAAKAAAAAWRFERPPRRKPDALLAQLQSLSMLGGVERRELETEVWGTPGGMEFVVRRFSDGTAEVTLN